MMGRIQELALGQLVRITLHAREEMNADSVTTDDLLRALASSRLELIEDYPEDQRGHSHLLLGWLAGERPIHICCAVHDGQLVVVTVYLPDEKFWMTDWRTRK